MSTNFSNLSRSINTHAQVIKTPAELRELPPGSIEKIESALNQDRANYMTEGYSHGQETKKVARELNL